MNVAMRARSISKKTVLMTAAFVLAVSSVTAAVPFIVSQTVMAEGQQVGNTWRVATLEDFKAALADVSKSHITLDADIATNESLVLSRSGVTINANGKTITGPNLGGVWQPGGNNYGLKIYKATNVTINSLKVTGANVGIQLNGSSVEFRGHTHVSGNAFGGIELSKGSGVTATPAFLHGQGTLHNTTEAQGKPTLWTVGDDAVVTSNIVPMTKATHVVSGQNQYYLNVANAGVVARNVDTSKTYASVQAAIDDASTDAGDVISIEQNVTLVDRSIRLNKSVVLEGNGKTVATQFNRGEAGVSNAAVVVLASNAAVQNLTVKGNAAGTSAAHGIVVFEVNNVTLKNIVARDNAAGVIVNASGVTVDTIQTVNNNWYGINVDKASASLTIKGENVHADAPTKPAIFTENRGITAVIDQDNQYVINTLGSAAWYVQDISAPVVSINTPAVDGLVTKNDVAVRISATDDNLRHYWYEVKRNGVSVKTATVMSSGVTNQWVYTATTEGVYTVQVSARDKAGAGASTGNRSETANVTFTIDKTAPVVTFQLPISGTVVSGDVHTRSRIANETNMVSRVTYLNDTVIKSENMSGVTGRNSEIKFDSTQYADGEYTIRVVATDQAGNESEASQTFIIDNTAPSTPVITSPAANAEFETTVRRITANWSASDDQDGSGVKQYEIRYSYVRNGQPVVESRFVNGTSRTQSLSGAITSAFTIEVRAEDNAGFWSEWSTPVTYYYGVDAPVVEVPGGEDDDEETGEEGGNNGGGENGGNPNTGGQQGGGVTPPQINPVLPVGAAVATPVSTTSNLPLAFVQDANSQVLGEATTNQNESNANAANNGEAAVEGVSTFAQTAEAEANNDGKIAGLAWYWWVLILAALAGLVWWLVAAARRRQSEN